MRKIAMMLATMALALSVCAGAAFAFGDTGPGVTKTCQTSCESTSYPDDLMGTDAANHIEGLGGNESPTFGGKDTLYGDRGGDKIEGGYNADTIFGGPDPVRKGLWTVALLGAVLLY